ncbi:MAG: CHAT domain-containing protein [Okeania sp. SIO3I5]|uniref:pentapeptide repeat-containing protein n=1 Tax=Okeania sp. SIO3I5 TaxID=2607805 RepID=UPI0013B8FD06|nr:pentapeptide repeat-containing protein [Okeania sp. SIO3I5]NEQ37212.1 CHAT domain-containing protein [Okeania sp. SIO3I5]
MLIHSSKQQLQNYQGRSFKNRDLTNQDFSYADIRGADFTGANLTNANFNYALAGLTKSQVIRLFIITAILSITAGLAADVAVAVPIKFLVPKSGEANHLGAAIFMFIEFVNIALLVATIRQQITETIKYLFYLFSLMILTFPILAALAMDEEKVDYYFRFFGISEAPDWVVWLSRQLGMFRGGSITESVTFWFNRQGDVSPVMGTIVTLIISIVAIFVLILTLSLAVVLAEIIVEKWLGYIAIAGAGILAVITTGITTHNSDNGYEDKMSYLWMVVILAVSLSLTLILITRQIAKQILAEDEKNLFILRIAVGIGTLGGTCFKDANLTDADFSHAILKSTNFRFANTTRTFWRETKYLKFARVEATILEDIKVRELLITGWGKDQQYIEANLRGANLVSAELSNANLKLADLGEASLKAANLNNANLTEALAIGTNFTTAQMSGTCLEAWNIDHTTILDNIESKYIYLLEEPKPETDDRERRPSSGYFQEGDFTKLFIEVLNTVDLIFRNGVDAKAFMSSFQQVQVENQGIPMKIQGMENKGDGVVVIRIDVPPEIEKEKIHRDFMEFYDQNVKVLEEKYQKELAKTEKQITLYRQRTEQTEYQIFLMNQILKTQNSTSVIAKEKLVTLNFEGGNFATGFPVIRANISLDSHPFPISFSGKLPPNSEIPQLYQDWREKDRQLQELKKSKDNDLSRIKIKKNQKTNVSEKEIDKQEQKIINQIRELKKKWRSLLNNWLNTSGFYPIEKELRTKFNSSDKVRLIIQSEDALMQRIPWHLWSFFSDYQFAETAIGLPKANRVEKLNIAREKIRILAIFGDDKDINIEADKQYLENLSKEVTETVSLVKPNRQELHQKLWDKKGWDIICFSGHSQSESNVSTGCFYLDLENQIKMTIEELENALTAAIKKGLQLAIFNSCDGLGLARQLAQLHIPAIIVMREPVPDLVAQEFLKHFLQLFSSGESLSISVRQAREKLESLEDKFPAASWLPVICQNSAEIPPTWQSLYGIFQPNFAQALAELKSAIEVETWLTSADKIEAAKQVDILFKVGEFSTSENQETIKSSMRILRSIVAEHPAANLMDETLNKLSIYFLDRGNHE